MSLLNYTTSVPTDKTIGEIQKILVKAGARAIFNEYDDQGFIVAMSFKLVMNDQEIGFRLPTDWRPVLTIMSHDPRVPRGKRTQDQALRVSWRIIKDWVEAQLAIVETKMVTTTQVFLPYAITGDGNTLYDKVITGGLLLGNGNKNEETI